MLAMETLLDFLRRMRILPFTILLLLTVYQSSGLETIVYNADEIRVEDGLFECISDCSKDSLLCQLEECSTPETSSSSAPSPNIENVYLERFIDPVEDRIKLALYVKWKPKANADIESTTGFSVAVSNEETTYRRCYNFPAPLTMANVKDEFSNDCFGKIEGTSIKLGSTVTVNITSLPLAEEEAEYGTTMLVVNIPDCSNNDLEAFEECQTREGRTTSESCEANCNTFSAVEDGTYPIACSISKNVLGSGPEKCPASNRTLLGTPSHPKRVEKEEWYKFVDSGEIKVALNFSWKPKDDSSIKDLPGYYIEVIPQDKSDQTFFQKCFTIHTSLTEKKHKNAEFFYDCYGRQPPTTVTPGKTYKVVIRSRNGSDDVSDYLIYDLKVPGCGDPRMEDVGYCITQNNRYLEGKIDRIVCENRTLIYTYRVSEEYGNSAQVGFCETGTNEFLKCQGKQLEFYPDLKLSGTLYNLSLPSSANLTINYTIFVNGNEHPTRDYDITTLSECVGVEPISVVAIALISVALIIILLVVAFCIWFIFYRHKYACGILRRYQDVYWSPLERYPDNYKPPVKVPGVIKVYVAFSEDHVLHKHVIHWFCTFLKHELGVDVHSSIWDGNDASANRARYIMESVRDADKVVIICSPGGTDCLKSPNDDEIKDDLFSPVVNQACQNLVARKNPEKYVVAYFGYNAQQHIPKLLLEQIQLYSKTFNLMKQFEQFYFRLVNIEQYQETGILKIKEIERYADASRRSDCGKKLHAAIEMMSMFAQANPTWYTKGVEMAITGTPSLPAPGTPNHVVQGIENPIHNFSNPDPRSGQPSISHMHPTPPPEALVQNGIEARPKVRQIPQNPEYVNICEEQVQNAQNPSSKPPGKQQVHPAQDKPRLQPQEHSNRYPHAGTAEWTPSNRLPLENVEHTRKPQEHESVLDSTGSSFEIPDTYISSLSPSKAASKPQLEQNGTADPTTVPPYMSRNQSYHADSFSPSDFPLSNFDNGIDSFMMTNLPSNQTEMTSIGLQSTQAQEQNKLIDQLLSPERKPSTEESPESGLFTLANLDEDEGDIEDQIKSINISSSFGLTNC